MITFIFQNWAILHALALPNSMQLCEQLHYRFASVRQVYTFARFCHERGIVLHFVAEPYLDIGNERTRAIDEDTFKLIIATMKNGFTHEGVQYKPNERIAGQNPAPAFQCECDPEIS